MLKNNRINMILALLIAIGLWVYVVGVENPKKDIQIKDVPITFTNADSLGADGLTLLSVSDSFVDVQVTGVRSEIKNVDKNDIKIVADLEGYKEGEHIVRLQIGKINNVEIESKQKISIVVDQLITEEKPVAVSLEGSISDDIEPYIVQVSQQSVEVTGAKTLVESIVRVDAPLDIAKVESELKSFTVNLLPLNQDGETVGKVQLSTGSISVSAVNLSKKTVPLDITVIGAESLDVERTVTLPKTITIKGLEIDLRTISRIAAEPLDVSNIYEDAELKVVPVLPEGVEAAANSQNLRAQITVRGMESRTFTYINDAVIAEGIDENMMVTVEPLEIKLQVTGRDSIVEALTGEEFHFVVNVRNLEPGTHRVILNCRYSTQLSVVEFEPEVVTVHIASQDAEGTPEGDESVTEEPGTAENEIEEETEAGQESENVPAA